MREFSLEATLQRSAKNRASRWPKQTAQNRLEPECWPDLNPGFDLTPGATVFTIGSCFARNIETHLPRLGFKIPTRDFVAENGVRLGRTGRKILNKYTPAAIYQALEWTQQISGGRGEVTHDDIAPDLLEIGNGKVVDLQWGRVARFGVTPEEALILRRGIYHLFTNAFSCDVVVITLGLIECWLDTHTGRYVDYGEYLRKHDDKDRFVFKRLDFTESYEFVRKSIDLINASGKKNILITTSPVPLARTFTDDDVIVANTYSKSVLRVVAGQIAEQYSNVDYFPSFESVMLSKSANVWDDDLRHVASDFVGRIMGRLVERYVSDGDRSPDFAALDDRLDFASLVEHGRFEEARHIYDQSAAVRNYRGHLSHLFAIAEMKLHFHEFEQAASYAQKIFDVVRTRGDEASAILLRCATVFDAAGQPDAAAASRALAFEHLHDPTMFKSLLHHAVSSGSFDEARRLLIHVEDKFGGDLELLDLVAQTYLQLGDFHASERICRLALEHDPHSCAFATRLGNVLLRQQKQADALVVLEKAFALHPQEPALLDRLIRVQLAMKRWDEAERTSRLLIAVLPFDSSGHRYLADVLRWRRRDLEALSHARRALELDPDNPKCRKLVDQLQQKTGVPSPDS